MCLGEEGEAGVLQRADYITLHYITLRACLGEEGEVEVLQRADQPLARVHHVVVDADELGLPRADRVEPLARGRLVVADHLERDLVERRHDLVAPVRRRHLEWNGKGVEWNGMQCTMRWNGMGLGWNLRCNRNRNCNCNC